MGYLRSFEEALCLDLALTATFVMANNNREAHYRNRISIEKSLKTTTVYQNVQFSTETVLYNNTCSNKFLILNYNYIYF